MDIEKLIELHPLLYHMAERDTWSSIQSKGLLSTTAVLDHFGLRGADREPYESQQRPKKMTVQNDPAERIVLRDQKPMPRQRLVSALKDGTSPEQWYRLINDKVFFWTTEERLLRLLNARDYRGLEHDVLTIDSAPFIKAYAEKIWLCHMNSGNTWPMPHARSIETFKRIPGYPAKRSGIPQKPIAELVVDYHVPDIADYVIDVRRMQSSQVLKGIS